MTNVDYSTVVRSVCGLASLSKARLQDADWTELRCFAEWRLRTAWESEFWPEVMRMERRTCRNEWLSTKAYVVGDEVFYTPSGNYFCVVKGSTNQAPATGSPLATNTAYWAASMNTYSATEYVAATAYVAGNQVYYATTGRFYQCHTASTGNLPTNTSFWGRLTVFDPYIPNEQAADALGVTTLTVIGTTATCTTSAAHRLETGDMVTVAGADQSGFNGRFTVTVTSDTVFTFTVIAGLANAAGTMTVTPFIYALGEVFEVLDSPKTRVDRWREYNPQRSANGLQVLGSSPVVWVGFRRLAPLLVGDTWTATDTYTAGGQVYFETAGSVGNFWDCVTATTAGQSPTTNPEKWARTDVPLRFTPYLIRGIYADWLTSQGQPDKATMNEQWAQASLAEECDKLYRQQGLQPRIRVTTY